MRTDHEKRVVEYYPLRSIALKTALNLEHELQGNRHETKYHEELIRRLKAMEEEPTRSINNLLGVIGIIEEIQPETTTQEMKPYIKNLRTYIEKAQKTNTKRKTKRETIKLLEKLYDNLETTEEQAA